MKNILTILFLLTSQFLFAQDLIITGKILESTNQEPIPFATIGIFGEPIGTVSNDQGEYELHINQKYAESTLSVSCIGYSEFSLPIKDIAKLDSFNIVLDSKAYVLNAFTVYDKQLTAMDIVEEAMGRIPINYLTKPYQMDGFYREYFQENDEYKAFAEAAVSVYDAEGYAASHPKSKESITLNQIRVSDVINDGDYVLYIEINYALRGNVMRNLEFWKKYMKKYRFKKKVLKIDSMTYSGDDLVYCISYEAESNQRGSYKGNIYIRTTDFAVLRLEINAINLLKGRIVNGAPHKTKSVMSFRDHNGKLYLNYINASHDVIYEVTGKRYKLKFFSELQVNNLKTKKISPNIIQHRAEEKSIFYLPRYRSYNPEFWADYNLFLDSPANALIIEDLEATRPLDKQFRANGKLKINKTLRAPVKQKKSKYAPKGITDEEARKGELLPQKNTKKRKK